MGQPEKKRKLVPSAQGDKNPNFVEEKENRRMKKNERLKILQDGQNRMKLWGMMPASSSITSVNYQRSLGFFQTPAVPSLLPITPVTADASYGIKKISMEGDLNFESPDYIIQSHIVLSQEEKARRMKALRDNELQLMDVFALIRIEPATSKAEEPSGIEFEKLDLSYLFNSPDITISKKLSLIKKLCDISDSDLLIPRLVLSKIFIDDKLFFPLEKNKEKEIKEYLTRKINCPTWSDEYKKNIAETHAKKKPQFNKVDFPSYLFQSIPESKEQQDKLDTSPSYSKKEQEAVNMESSSCSFFPIPKIVDPSTPPLHSEKTSTKSPSDDLFQCTKIASSENNTFEEVDDYFNWANYEKLAMKN